MVYVFDINTEANRAATDKKKTVMTLEKGVTYRLNILFPPGPNGLLHVVIADALHHVWPTNADADFASDAETIIFDDEYPLSEPPYELYAYTWNLDDTYEHSVIIRIGVNPIKIVEPERVEALLESWRVPPEAFL